MVTLLVAMLLVALVPSSAQIGGGLSCPDGTPLNDCIEDSVQVDQMPYLTQQSTVGATTSHGENTICSALPAMGSTVWYRFSPEETSQVTANTTGSDFDTVLAVHLLTDEGVLLQVACNDDADFPDDTTSEVSWHARAGATYFIQIGGFQMLMEAEQGELEFGLEEGADA